MMTNEIIKILDRIDDNLDLFEYLLDIYLNNIDMVSTRQMIRNCGFTSNNGKTFTKVLGRGYLLEAKLIKINGNKHVRVSKYHGSSLMATRDFLEDVDYNEMLNWCSIQSF